MTTSIWNVIVRMLRAVGIEVLWNTHLSLESPLCPGEISLWRHLVRFVSLHQPTSSSTTSIPRSGSSICNTDIDDCDCDPTMSSTLEISTPHLLDERLGFYHVVMLTKSLTSEAISLEKILPQSLARFQSSPNLAIDQELLQHCEARPLPIFLQLQLHDTNSSISVSHLPLSLQTLRQGPWGSSEKYLRGNEELSTLSREAGLRLSKTLNPSSPRRQRKQLSQPEINQLFARTQKLRSCH